MEIILQVINLSVITDNLCKKMYECIENELLGSLQCTTHNISPYISKGIEKASELYVYWNSEAGTTTEKSVGSYCGTNSYLRHITIQANMVDLSALGVRKAVITHHEVT
ncbi:probable E3 ubiquitin-protein ligase ARI1 [Hibiscus syriacus]|uniref:probable E3 ubiquitin-protein ligase ARI1 n=1 Tax=Hibiscus syriacus TaxID=106335 RepID=UPI00192207F3|nr:probable E3 ubiquitin-protein ligase ARI1 [Hibiscus syriacus]